MKNWKFLSSTLILLMLVVVPPAFGDVMYLCDNPYTLFQMGNNGFAKTEAHNLDIQSNSSVFGSTLKGFDGQGGENKISTSKVMGTWDRETNVNNLASSSYTGGRATLTPSQFDPYANTALQVSSYWAGINGTNIAINLNSNATQTIDVSGGTPGANVYDVTGQGVSINSGSKLILSGDPGDFFVFNLTGDQYFFLNSNSIIQLAGDIEASEVLWNVTGASGTLDNQIQSNSIFQGTLLSPGKNVLVSQNHFYTFESSGYPDDEGGTQAPSTTEITAAQAIAEKTGVNPVSGDWGGLWGQVIAGGKINFSESDIANDPFCPTPVPIPGAVWLLGSGLIGLVAMGRRRFSK